jgi:hypothetical protein
MRLSADDPIETPGGSVEGVTAAIPETPAAPTVLSSADTIGAGRALMATRAICALSGAIGVVLALAVTPDLVARHWSPDHQLFATTTAAVHGLRGAAAVLGIALLTLALRERWAYLSLRTIVDANAGVWPWAALAAGLALGLNGAGVFVAATTGTPMGLLLGDPNATAGQPSYYGGMEYAGIILMAATAGIALFSSAFSPRRAARFLILGGLFTLWLVLDDAYMLHEQSPRIYLSERLVFGIYGVLLLAFVLTNLTYLLQTPFALLVTAGAFFALGIAFDSFVGLARLFPNGLENMLELVGICFWSAYFIKCSRNALRHRRARGITESAPG